MSVHIITTPGRCQYCGCTDARACEDGCFWIDDAHTVCSGARCVDQYFGEKAAALRRLLAGIYQEFVGGRRS